jgi:hypothetical protein
MKLKLTGGTQRVPRVLFKGEGTSKININKSIVPAVPLVPSIILRARVRAKNIGIHVISLPGYLPYAKMRVPRVPKPYRYWFSGTLYLAKVPSGTLYPSGWRHPYE